MAYTVIQAREPARALEQQLDARLKDDKSTFNNDIAGILDEIREFCASKLLENIENAIEVKIDERLWKAHQSVNTRFRGQFAKLSRAKVVERRKLNTDYLKFLKASQRFFRKYILDLYNTYGLPELARVARKVDKAVTDSKQSPDGLSATSKELVLSSCHTTLIQLGDLSRYRETEVPSKNDGPDWSSAIGYYDLAGVVLPASGVSAHQLAVLALQEKDHFGTVYHLYRCLVAKEPHPHALPNLKRAFHKLSGLKEPSAIFESGSRNTRSHVLRTWYLQAVVECFHGRDIQSGELEKELMQHFTDHVRVETSDTTLQKIALTNIAATAVAREHFLEGLGDDPANSFLAFLRLTLQCLLVTLDRFQEELEHLPAQVPSAAKLEARITSGLAYLLPSLRLYSSWLFDYGAIVSGAKGMGIETLQQAYWTTLVRCLNLAADLFPVDRLPTLQYMLEEDSNTVGFLPLHNGHSRQLWFNTDGSLRATREETQNTPVTAIESLFRVRYMLLLGVTLATQDDNVPIALVDSKFKCTLVEPASVATDHRRSDDSIRPPPGFERTSVAAVARNPPQSMPAQNYQDVRAERMVDDLVSGSSDLPQSRILDSAPIALPVTNRHETTAAGNGAIPSTLSAPRASGSYNIQDIVKTFRPSPGPRASPGISPRFVPSSGIHSPSFRPLSSMHRSSQSSLIARDGSVDAGRVGSGILNTPMNRTFSGRSHARVNSSESIHSRRSIWTPEPGLDGPVSPSLHSPNGTALGNGTFGAGEEVCASSTMLFGAGNSPWSLSAQERQGMSLLSPSPKTVQWARSGLQARPFG